MTAHSPHSGDQGPAKAQLRVLDGCSQGATLELSDRRTRTLGRSRHNDLQIGDHKVSRQHCKIEFDGRHFWLVDVESRNGTFVNDDHVRRYMLYDGDVIKLGGTSIVFRLGQADGDSSRAAGAGQPD